MYELLFCNYNSIRFVNPRMLVFLFFLHLNNAFSVCLIRVKLRQIPCKTKVVALSNPRFLTPLSAVPLVALVGFGLYELGFPGVSFLLLHMCAGIPKIYVLVMEETLVD